MRPYFISGIAADNLQERYPPILGNPYQKVQWRTVDEVVETDFASSPRYIYRPVLL